MYIFLAAPVGLKSISGLSHETSFSTGIQRHGPASEFLGCGCVLAAPSSLGNALPHRAAAVGSSVYILIPLAEMGLVVLLTRRRSMPDLAERAPERRVTLWETMTLWV